MAGLFHCSGIQSFRLVRQENMHHLKIGIIVGSTRPGRKAEAIAKWIFEFARTRSDANSKSWTLPTSNSR